MNGIPTKIYYNLHLEIIFIMIFNQLFVALRLHLHRSTFLPIVRRSATSFASFNFSTDRSSLRDSPFYQNIALPIVRCSTTLPTHQIRTHNPHPPKTILVQVPKFRQSFDLYLQLSFANLQAAVYHYQFPPKFLQLLEPYFSKNGLPKS